MWHLHYIIFGLLLNASGEFNNCFVLDSLSFLNRFYYARYTIDKTEKNFIVDMSVKLCMDSNAPCQFETDIFKRNMIPIPICNLDMDFSISSITIVVAVVLLLL